MMMYPIDAIQTDVQQDDVNEQVSRYHNIQGTKNADEGRLREALNNFTRAIGFNPENYIAYFNRGTVKADLGDYEGAKRDFATASKIVLGRS